MSEPIPALLSCGVLFLASVATLLSLARTARTASVPSVRRLATPPFHVTPVVPGPCPCPARHAEPLAGEATRAVRPYVTDGTEAA